MRTHITWLSPLAAAAGFAGFFGIAVAQADPPPGDCNVLWGDYCYVRDQQNQPLAPPSISWDQGLGTSTAHITDHSGVASQCSYSSELINRSFALPANGSFDVVIAPAVPAFRN